MDRSTLGTRSRPKACPVHRMRACLVHPIKACPFCAGLSGASYTCSVHPVGAGPAHPMEPAW